MPWFDRRRPWRALRAAWRVAAWARKQGAELIHCNEHDVYPFASLLRRLLPRPMICHVRYLIAREFAEWCFRGKRRPDALLWTSQQQREDSGDAVAGLVPEQTQHLVRLGINVERCDAAATSGKQLREQLGIADEQLVVGAASPLRPRKRVLDFIEVVQQLCQRYPQLVGLIAGGEIEGDEDYRRAVQQRVEQSGLGARLRWLGNLDPIEPFHHACDISVSTSEYETFGNSVCEAMACGKPVVAYAGGSVGEVLGETGLLTEVGDQAALEQKVQSLLDNRSERVRLGTLARQRVQTEFSPEKSFHQLQAIYGSIVASRSPQHHEAATC